MWNDYARQMQDKIARILLKQEITNDLNKR
jgi:hypothetical protein